MGAGITISKSIFGQQLECWNYGKTSHFKKNCRELKKKIDNDAANVVATKEVYDALLLSVESPLDSCVLDSEASFYITLIREVLENYVVGDFGKVYLVNGTALDLVLCLETRGRGQDRNSGQGRSNSRKGRSKSRIGQQLECWNCGKTGHFKKNCRELKKKIDNNAANVMATEEVYDALLLSVESPLDS
jgi:DNA-binding protein Fis